MTVNWFKRQIASLYRESVAHRFLSKTGLITWLDDEVGALKNRPLGMFFYNQRALFLGVGLGYLLTLGMLAWDARFTLEADIVWLTVEVLVAFWLLDILVTIALHRSFTRRVASWAADPIRYPYAAIFDRYFVIDSCIVLALIFSGKLWNLNLDAYVSLLIANTVVYSSAYAGGRKGNRRQIIVVICFQIIITVLLVYSHIELREPRIFSLVLGLGAFVGMALVTVFSVLVISWLRTLEHETSELRLRLLANSEQMLAGIRRSGSDRVGDHAAYSERQFRDLARQLLDILCSQGEPFWYHSACLWLLEKHQDRGKNKGQHLESGRVLLPAAWVNFDEANRLKDGLDDPDDLLTTKQIVTVPSLRLHTEGMRLSRPPLRSTLDGPAAFVPLVRGDREIGVLAVYGRERGAPLLYDDTTFLWGLGSIISNTMEQWEGRYKMLPQKEMDELFACSSLDEMFPRAVKTLKRYLEASGCMIIFRPDPTSPEMEVRAVNGFRSSLIQRNIYKVGVGQTGKCAESGEPIKWDNVQNHLEVFDDERLRVLQKALGKEVVSWMSIPIGPKHSNFGVIKVVNSTGLCPWFTDYDKHLGLLLAQRLQIMIEKFLHIDEIEKQLNEIAASRTQAQLSARDAKVAQQKAEESARQRQDDLMIVTHQLQAPLNSVISGVTLMQRGKNDKRLDYIRGFIEDALALCFGTFTTFAREAGRETAFSTSNIDAPAALRKLCKRLQMTNAREDLSFRFHEEPGFPTVKMDWRVFTSVFFSLIHNAMKYAEKYSHVTLECSFERVTGRAALKVRSIGEPIDVDEKETIFQKYGRGRIITTTGRYHSGVGLGLWVARELMRAVGGDLTIELSEGQPDLSVFVVLAPPAE